METCGFVSDGDKLSELLPLVDLFLSDVKCIDDEKHRRFTGVSNETILRNARSIASSWGKMIVRIPLVPGFNDANGDIEAIGDFVLSLISVKEVNILPYHELGKSKYGMLGREYGLEGEHALGEERVQELRSFLESADLSCTVD